MSASYKNQDGFIYFPHKLNEFEQSMFSMQFDLQCDFDIQDIRMDIEDSGMLRKVCIFKLLLSIPEYILTLILFGKRSAQFKLKATKIYYEFFRNRMTLDEFQKELTEVMTNGRII